MLIIFATFIFIQKAFQQLAELVGTGSRLASAADAAHTFHRIGHLHTGQQTGNSLQVSVAAADDFH